ncbi:MAG: radical SAM protein [Thermodesulfobacteriota bacterium]
MAIDPEDSRIFGPVPSRRLGRSLGVDLVPFKTCTYDCIYCQLGRTTNQTLERRSYAKAREIIEELKKKLSNLAVPPDYITFSGSGEPTLNSEIGLIIREIKKITHIPIAVLTNGSLLHLERVRADLANADLVIPSLDAASPQLFKFINRPHHSLHHHQILRGLKKFRSEFSGQIWLEIMLCAGINDDPKELPRLKEVIESINPDRVQLNTVVRPPAEKFAYPLSLRQLEKVKNILGNNAEIIPQLSRAEEFAPFPPRDEEILEMLKRRPCTAEEIARALGYNLEAVYQCLHKLRREGIINYRMFSERCYYELPLPAGKVWNRKPKDKNN